MLARLFSLDVPKNDQVNFFAFPFKVPEAACCRLTLAQSSRRSRRWLRCRSPWGTQSDCCPEGLGTLRANWKLSKFFRKTAASKRRASLGAPACPPSTGWSPERQYCKTFFAAIDGLKLRIFYYFISGETELIEHASFIDIYKSVYSLAHFMTFSVF